VRGKKFTLIDIIKRAATSGRRAALIGLSCALLISAPVGRALAGSELAFPTPQAIQPNVNFWVDVFTTYSVRDFVLHDRDQVDRVYQVMHVPGYGDPSRTEVSDINDYLKTKYVNLLNRLAQGQSPANSEEQHIADMFKGEPLSAYTLAADNLRVQQGLRERFREGLLRSKYYRPTMERIFRGAGLPPELVTLATVESGFYSRAKSSAGAVGIWQFMPSTGRQYMKITRYHDDRLNPATETEAAAQLLRSNYDALGSWPLAITAYNYGTGGTSAAASQFGGDYDRMVRGYNGPHFGFAARNYYAEFLAALQVHQDEDKYFPDLKYAEVPEPPPVKTDFAPPPRHRSRHGSVHRAVSHGSNHHVVQHHSSQALKSRPVSGRASVMRTAQHPHSSNHHRRPIVADEQSSDHDS
jgi:membrane-bound lytic murein transglycosylase D